MNENLENRILFETREQFYSRFYSERNRLCLDSEPLRVTDEIVGTTWNIVEKYPYNTSYRAIAIYNWISENISKDTRPFDSRYKYSTAAETFRRRKGKCADFAFLYSAMARVAGLESSFVTVFKAYDGDTNPHACSSVRVRDQQGIIFVDPGMSRWDAKHISYNILTDNETTEFYYSYCLNWNRQNPVEFNKASDRFGFKKDRQQVYYYNNPKRTRDLYSHGLNKHFGYAALLTFTIWAGINLTGIGAGLLEDLRFSLFGNVDYRSNGFNLPKLNLPDIRFFSSVKDFLPDLFDEFDTLLNHYDHKVEVRKPITREIIEKDYRKRFEALLDHYSKRYPDDERFKNIWYSSENYTFLIRLKINEIKASL